VGDKRKPVILTIEEGTPIYEVDNLPFTERKYRLVYSNVPKNSRGERFSKENSDGIGDVASYLETRERLIKKMRLIVLSLAVAGATIALILVTIRPI